MKELEASHILVAGLVRNDERTIFKDIKRIRKAFSRARKVSFFLVESDSTDSTVRVLKSLEKSIENFRFVSLGDLEPHLLQRTERLAHCRNRYMQELASSDDYLDVDFLAVADLDGVNQSINEESVRSNWNIGAWDAVFANQQGLYYDIWALRHPLWCPIDSNEQLRFLNEIVDWPVRNQRTAIRGKMIRIPSRTAPIEVDSAFGGFGIYRRESLKNLSYAGSDFRGHVASEHVFLHENMRLQGRRLVINPAFIAGKKNEHSSTLRYLWIAVRMVAGRFVRAARSVLHLQS